LNERLVAINSRLSVIRLVFALVLLLSWSCHNRRVAIPPPVPTNPEPVKSAPIPTAITPPTIVPTEPATLEPAPLKTTITTQSNFDLGEMNFQIGNYSRAANYYEAFLKDSPKAKDRDRALYYLGLARAITLDSGRAETAFKRLISEFPKSQYKNPAEYILGIQARIENLKSEVKDRDEKIKRLSEELQKLKDIDMQRRPSRSE
jgi:tetratricopeptide (TPR) repeat protein